MKKAVRITSGQPLSVLGRRDRKRVVLTPRLFRLPGSVQLDQVAVLIQKEAPSVLVEAKVNFHDISERSRPTKCV